MPSALATNLKKLIEASGKPEAEVARDLGYSERRFNHYTAGKRRPPQNDLPKIAKYFGIGAGDLLAEDSESRYAELDKHLAVVKTVSTVESETVHADAGGTPRKDSQDMSDLRSHLAVMVLKDVSDAQLPSLAEYLKALRQWASKDMDSPRGPGGVT